MALKFAIHNPEKINRLILLAPGGIVQAKRSFILKAVLSYILKYRNKEISNRFNYGNQAIYPNTLEFMDVIADHFGLRFEALLILTADELERLNMPTLLMAGARDDD